MKALWMALCAAALLLPASGMAAEVSDEDRGALWNDCRPMTLLIKYLASKDDAPSLTKERIEVTVRSRLRAARLYTEDDIKANWAQLFIRVNVYGNAFSDTAQYSKPRRDLATELTTRASSWSAGGIGTYAQDASYILSSVAEGVDRFIDEYLRVNADACE